MTHITQCNEAVTLITLEAFKKTIADAKQAGNKITTKMIVNEVTSNQNGAIAKRFLEYIALGHQAFEMVKAGM